MIVIAFAPLFSKPVFQHVQVLVQGAILAPSSRTVASALRVMGKAEEKNFQNYHRVLSRAEWSCLHAAAILLKLLVKVFVPCGTIMIGMDDTIERRRGEQIKAKGIYRDPVRSSHSHFVKASGLRWLCLMLVVEVPFAKRVWALPFLSVLCPSERYDKERGVSHRKLTDRARQALWLIARWLPGREIVVVADSSFAALDLLYSVKEKVTVVTRLRLDAALYEPVADRKKGQLGRPRKKGNRLPTLQQVADNPQTQWERVSIPDWYGSGEREVDITSGTCVWYHIGKEAVPLRWVLLRDPQGKFETQALLGTKLEAEPQQIICWFSKRWQLEVTFEESRRHLGIETRATMVRQSYCKKHSLPFWFVFRGDNLCTRVGTEAKVEFEEVGLVRKGRSNLLGCNCSSEALFMGRAAFSDIEKRSGDDKNPACIHGTLNRYALLCGVNG